MSGYELFDTATGNVVGYYLTLGEATAELAAFDDPDLAVLSWTDDHHLIVNIPPKTEQIVDE